MLTIGVIGKLMETILMQLEKAAIKW
jgi:hypothetical protein